jgi:translation initiation factor 2B subunit (eIF-2B alpha/beta/delta family)
MATCYECKFFIKDEKDPLKGLCRGVEVNASRDKIECPQQSFQKKLIPWLIPEYKNLLDNLKKNVEEYYSEKVDKELFTLHDLSHCESVEKMAKVLVTKGPVILSSLERFILSCASWTHDIGMNTEAAKAYFANAISGSNPTEFMKFRRKEHHNISCWKLQKDCIRLFSIQEDQDKFKSAFVKSLSRAISLVIQYHRKIEDIRVCPKIIYIKSESVRIQLLAGIFRLADTLHKDISRFDSNLYAILQIASFDRVSRLHWLKSFVVSNIHLNENAQTITIGMDLPDFSQFDDLVKPMETQEKQKVKRDWTNRVRNLEYIITSDIEEDLVVVNEIFSRHGMPTYVNVDIQVSYIRGFDREYLSEIDSVLSELDILFSPNTSKVIKRSLDSLKTLSLTRFDTTEQFNSSFAQLLGYLEEIHSHRPCHVGLSNIIYLLRPLLNDRKVDKPKRLCNLVTEIDKYRRDAEKRIIDKVGEIIPADTKNIILIGFSSTIMSLLNEFALHGSSKKDQGSPVNIFVLECATKRRLGHSNLIEYNDGIHFATEIGKLGFFRVHIIPDIGLATLINKNNISEISSANSMVLFGANGIDYESGDCGHTSGHLSVAIMAKHSGIPVKIIADSFKIGRIDWKTEAEREGAWLVTQNKFVEELSNNRVKLINLREDRIPKGLLWEIHTDNSCIIFKKGVGDECDPEEVNISELKNHSEYLINKFIKIRDNNFN